MNETKNIEDFVNILENIEIQLRRAVAIASHEQDITFLEATAIKSALLTVNAVAVEVKTRKFREQSING